MGLFERKRFVWYEPWFFQQRMAKNQFRKREGIPLNLDANDLVPVEIFARNQFANTVQRIRELGFLQADPRGQRMLFEGKKERWCIPARSIHSLAIEEVQLGTPGQSATGALNYEAPLPQVLVFRLVLNGRCL